MFGLDAERVVVYFFGKYSTHVIECVGNQVVSARKAHVEIPKVERFRMRRAPEGQKTPNYAMRCTCSSTFIRPKERLNFSISPSPGLRLSHSSALYSLRWVRSISLHASSAWNLQGSRQWDEIRSVRRRRLLMKGGTSIGIHTAASIPQEFLAS